MASLSATTSSACQGTQGVLTLSAFADAPGAPAGGEYRFEILDANNADLGGPVYADGLPHEVPVPDGAYTVRVLATYPNGSTAASSPRDYTLSCSGNTTPPGGGGNPPPAVLGCMAPNAFNYNADATQDTTPTSCVFVEVPQPLAGLVAAHLPIPVTVRAAPTPDGVPAIVVLVLQTAPSVTTPDAQWTPAGRLRKVCDDTATAAFNLSEAAKALLQTIEPPVESGIDPNLSVLLRARYQVLDPVTRTVTYEGLVGTCRAVNAVVQPTEGAVLTSPTPYATLPFGRQLWQSAVTYADGVHSTLLSRPTDACQPRQFVWLNSKGAWDQGFFYGRHVHTTDNGDPVPYRDLSGADRYASRGSVKPTLAVYSDVTDRATYELLRGLRLSIQVYERLGAGQYVPVLLTVESFPEYTEQTDKTFQVNFTVSYPAQLIHTQ